MVRKWQGFEETFAQEYIGLDPSAALLRGTVFRPPGFKYHLLPTVF